jgi:hypothetical protein
MERGLHRLQALGPLPLPLVESHRQGNSREVAKWGRLTRKFGRPAIRWDQMSVAFAHGLLVSGVFSG